ncbi:MAG: hypothetical protein GXO32_00920 [Crenarchaeota archaeon]|nr:hypothetical protein [Thermoproteota archaeon]
MLGAFPSVDPLGRRLIVVLQGFPCSWGRCSFCPFYLEQSASLRDILERNRSIVARAIELAREIRADRVTVFNGGSFFELPLAVIEMLKPLTRGRILDIESRPEFLSVSSVSTVLRILEPSRLVVRVGLEVFDERIRNEVLGKGIPQSEILRLSKLREDLRAIGSPVEVVAYVLFGIEGVPESEVVRSVREFNKLFDGVIAIRYRRYLPSHPSEAGVSDELRSFLERSCMYVDWGEGEEWSIGSSK